MYMKEYKACNIIIHMSPNKIKQEQLIMWTRPVLHENNHENMILNIAEFTTTQLLIVKIMLL